MSKPYHPLTEAELIKKAEDILKQNYRFRPMGVFDLQTAIRYVTRNEMNIKSALDFAKRAGVCV